MIWRLFFAGVKVNHRRVYCCVLVKACAVAMAMGLVKKGLKDVFSLFMENQVVRFSSSFTDFS